MRYLNYNIQSLMIEIGEFSAPVSQLPQVGLTGGPYRRLPGKLTSLQRNCAAAAQGLSPGSMAGINAVIGLTEDGAAWGCRYESGQWQLSYLAIPTGLLPKLGLRLGRVLKQPLLVRLSPGYLSLVRGKEEQVLLKDHRIQEPKTPRLQRPPPIGLSIS